MTRNAELVSALLATLPIAVGVYDSDHRLAMATDFKMMWTDLDPALTPIGTPFSVIVRLLAWKGIFGHGDPEALARAVLTVDRSRPHSRLQRSTDGRTMQTESRPLPGGGFLTCATDVSALSRAESESASRARLLETLLARLRGGVAQYDAQRTLGLTNPAYETLIGLSAGTLRPGMSHRQVLELLAERGELDAEELEDTVGRMAAGRFQPGSRQRIRPNGTALRIGSQPLPQGGFMVEVDEVTALKQAEDRANQRAALLDGVLEALPHGVCVYGPDRRVKHFNGAYGRIMVGSPVAIGDSVDDLVARRLAEGEFTAEQARQALWRPTLPGQGAAMLRHVRPNGTVVEGRVAALHDGGHIAVLTDVTALHRAEAESRQRAAMLDAMLASTHQGICLYDRDRRLLVTNARTASLIGLPTAFLQPGRLVDQVLDEQARRGEISPEAAARAKAYDRSRSYRYHRSTRDGRVIEVASDPTADGGFVMTFNDVTEDYRIRAELERARAEAEAGSEAKSRFLATMSHELRTPLNAVIGFSEAIALERDRQRLEDYARSINEAGRHLLLLIDDILDVARSQTGALDIESAPVALGPLLEGAGRAIADAAEKAGLTLELQVPPGLPALMGDAKRLHQLVLNLLSNATKFSTTGGRITLSAKVAEAGLAIRVADTGIGIAPEDRERVFEPFTQLDNSLARRFLGSGLGLYLTRTLAEALGGTVALEAPDGPGTVAVLRFPADRLIPAPPKDTQ